MIFNAQSAKFFQILTLKLLKIHEKVKNKRKRCENIFSQGAYFFQVSRFLGKCLFIPPPGGGGFRPEYLPLLSTTSFFEIS